MASTAAAILSSPSPRRATASITARVLEITLEGSPDHAYRLTVGALPYVTGWWPLSVPANTRERRSISSATISLTDTLTVKAGAEGEVRAAARTPTLTAAA